MGDNSQNHQKNLERFNDLMFGTRGEQHRKDYHSQESSTNSSSIDYEEILSSIDKIIESVGSLKPVVQSVLGQILKKK
ncbi:hypothetical protein [Neobacillus drentensis]|uniref:hypothetical protein n=1 Tax=Neobacillus drentensis TaxID=220684 RepID=UPI0030029C2E